jgi:hypothetical protein
MPVCALSRAHSVPLKYFHWYAARNANLRAERGIGFEDIVFHIDRGDLLDILTTRKGGSRRDCRIRG